MSRSSTLKKLRSYFAAGLFAGVFAAMPLFGEGGDAEPMTAPWGHRPETAEAPATARDGSRVKAENAQGEKLNVGAGPFRFYVPMVTGDRDKVEKLSVWKDWAEYITFNQVSGDEISAFRDKLLKALQTEGYVFASVEFPTAPWSQGFFVALVDCGPLGNITVKNAGRHYTQRQIIQKLSNRENRFNYAAVRNQLASLNDSADLKLDTTLKPVMVNGRRYVDAEVTYEDKLPIHGALELTNSASREADSDVQLHLTLQHNNLTRHNDVLTLNYITNGDVFDSVNAVYGSYVLPLDELWNFTVYGSWSDSENADVVKDLNVVGRGYSYGLQFERELYADAQHRFTAALGWKLARTRNRLELGGDNMDLTTAKVSMPYLTLGYSSLMLDRWNGRNFASLTFTGNRAGKWGASDRETFIEEGWNADGTFFQTRFNAARIQRLFDGDDHPGRWTLFAKTNIVYSDDTTPNSVREYLGGFDTIRGYRESEVGGDGIISASVELRTPLLENFIPGLSRTDEELAQNPDNWMAHRLQGVIFIDYGYISSRDYMNQPENGRTTHESLLSAGVGLRLGLTRYAQASLDYGLPLIKHVSSDTPDNGRFHLSLQLQF